MNNYQNDSTVWADWAEQYVQTVSGGSLRECDYEWAPLLYNRLIDRESDRLFGIESSAGFLLAGPSGTGRHTAAWGIAGDLAREENGSYNFVWISGDEIETGDIAEDQARVKALFDLTEKYGNTYYLFDKLKDLPNSGIIMSHIAINARAHKNSTFIVVVCDKESDINSGLRELLDCYHISLPMRAQRTKFFEREMQNGIGLPFDKAISMSVLVDNTENFDYCQLVQLVTNLRVSLKAKVPFEKRNSRELAEMIQSGELALTYYDLMVNLGFIGWNETRLEDEAVRKNNECINVSTEKLTGALEKLKYSLEQKLENITIKSGNGITDAAGKNPAAPQTIAGGGYNQSRPRRNHITI